MFWLNRDPIQKVGGLNLYSFAGNSPSIAVDASVLLATTPVVIVLVETVGTGTICATVGGLIWGRRILPELVGQYDICGTLGDEF